MNKKILVRQHDIKDCGPCCLLSIIKYYNGYIPLEKIKLDTKTDKNGTTALNIINTSIKYGFTAKGIKLKNLDINNTYFPFIAHIVTKNGLNHFVVIYKIKNKKIYIMDPSQGFIKKQIEEFYQEWTNIILIFKPYKKIPIYNSNNSLKKLFFDCFHLEKNVILKIIFFDIFITLLSIILGYYIQIVISMIEDNYLNTLIFVIIIFLIFNIFKLILEYYKNMMAIYLSKNIDINFIKEFLNHLFHLPLNTINSRTSGEILTRYQEIQSIKELFTNIFISLVLDLFLIIGSGIILYFIESKLFFILFIVGLLYTIFSIFINPLIFKKINNNIELETEFNSSLSEKVDYIESLKNLNIIDKELDKLTKKYISYEKNNFENNLFFNFFISSKDFINDIGIFIVTSLGIYFIYNNKISLLSFITFTTLINYFLEPLKRIIDQLPRYNYIKLSYIKISEFLNINKEKEGVIENFYLGDITFENISYSYDNFQNIIKNLNMIIKKNSHVKIFGPSGCGKSTLFQMLNKNIIGYQGEIKINNINIKDYSINTLRNNILYVSQREVIFTDSILNNITLEKDISKEELNKIIDITEVDKIINKKSLRLDTYLYDGGYNLSGGERQRIILARSLVLKPKILILDESLSEIDSKSEINILSNIDKYLKDTTIIYISHTNTKSFNNVINMELLYGK